MTVDTIFKEAVTAGLAPPLKEAGFRKQATRFRRAHGGCLQVIELQKSHGNAFDHLRFYINVGVAAPDLWVRFGGGVEAPKAHECHASARYEQLLPGMPAHLDITPQTDVAEMTAMLAGIARHLTGVLDAIDGTDALLEAPFPGNGQVAAQIHYAAGRDAEALEVLRRLEREFHDRQGMSVPTLARRLGLERLLQVRLP